MSSPRRGVIALTAVSSMLVLGPGSAEAQRGPVFELQPGITVIDFVSVPEGTVSNSAFSLRFTTRFPTSLNWLTPVVGGVFFPYGTTENTVRNTDAPTIFIGNVFPVVAGDATSGWLAVELPVVIQHSPGAGPTGNIRDYGRDLVILPTAYLNVGARALGDFGSIWSRLRLVVQLEQSLTPNRDPGTGHRDYFNPIATFGISLTIGAPRN